MDNVPLHLRPRPAGFRPDWRAACFKRRDNSGRLVQAIVGRKRSSWPRTWRALRSCVQVSLASPPTSRDHSAIHRTLRATSQRSGSHHDPFHGHVVSSSPRNDHLKHHGVYQRHPTAASRRPHPLPARLSLPDREPRPGALESRPRLCDYRQRRPCVSRSPAIPGDGSQRRTQQPGSAAAPRRP